MPQATHPEPATGRPLPPPPESPDRLAVVVCSNLAGHGLDLERLQSELSTRAPTTCVRTVEELCAHPDSAVRALREIGATRAVLATCRREIPEPELRARARREGYGPYDLLVVPVPTRRGAAAAATTIVAALARIALTPPGQSSRARATGSLSRGALLRLGPAFTLDPVAEIDASRCTGLARCGLCAEVCPAEAIRAADRFAEVDARLCDACGLCLSACPTNAIRIAGATLEQIEAQVATLLAEAQHAPLLLACTHARRSDADRRLWDEWEMVELPTLAAVTPGWIVQAFRAGAGRVHLLTCENSCCSTWRQGGGRLDLCRRLLPPSLAGRLSTGQVATPPAAEVSSIPGDGEPPELLLAEPAATVRGLDALGLDVQLEDAASPLGIVELDGPCTLCGACATACPTGSLTLREEAGESVLRFEPARCTGCTLCARACPENVLGVGLRIDSTRLTGLEQLASGPRRQCRCCGIPLLPQPLIERNRCVLGQGPTSESDDGELCADCRVVPRSSPLRPTRGRSAGYPR